MKPLALALALSLSATTAMAFGSFINSTTPTLTFPNDKSDGDTVTMEKMSVGK